MKKLLVIAVALAAVNAQATRARVGALANSPHLVDTQTVYNNPADIFALGSDYVNLESGLSPGITTGGTANANAEGMVVRTMGDTKWGLSLGHQSPNASSWGLRGQAAAAGFDINQQNPLELTYGAKTGDMGWAATLVYSNYQDKAAAGATINKENSMGVRLGARAGNWDAAVRLGLLSTVEKANSDKYTGTAAIGVNGGYTMDSWYLFGNLSTVGFKAEVGGAEVAKFASTQIQLGAMTEVKKDGSGFFYGASLLNTMSKEDVADTKVNTLGLPVFIGVEADAASWLTLRGSVTQTLNLLNNTKREVGGVTGIETAPGADNTTVAFGAGLKFNKVTLDGTILAAGTQIYNSAALLGQVGLTYWY